MAESSTDRVSFKSFAPGLLETVEKTRKTYTDQLQNALGLSATTVKEAAGNLASEKLNIKIGGQAAVAGQAANFAETDVAEKQMQAIIARFNAGSEEPTGEVMQAHQMRVVADQTLRKLTPEVTALKAVPMTDPLNWIVSQFKLMGISSQYNAAAVARDTASDQIATLQRDAGEAIRLEKPVLAQVRQQQLMAFTDAQAARVAHLKTSADKEFNLLRMNEEVGRMRWLGQDVEQATSLARLTAEGVSLSTAMSQKQAEEDELASINDTLVRKLHLNPIPSLARLRNLRPETRQAIELAALNKNTIAGNPWESMNVINTLNAQHGISQAMPAAASFMDNYSKQARAKLEEWKKDPTLPVHKLKPEAQDEASYKAVYEGWREELTKKASNQLSPSNPYRMKPEVAASVGKYATPTPGVPDYVPELKANVFIAFINSQKETGQIPKEGQLVEYALARLRAGDNRQAVLRDFTTFFQDGMSHQYRVQGMPMLSMDPSDPKHKSRLPAYVLNVEALNLDGQEADVYKTMPSFNAFNSTEVDNFFTRVLARRSQEQSLTNSGFLYEKSRDRNKAARDLIDIAPIRLLDAYDTKLHPEAY